MNGIAPSIRVDSTRSSLVNLDISCALETLSTRHTPSNTATSQLVREYREALYRVVALAATLSYLR